ncbi:DUF2934 domain-containing protein [Methylobacterium brachythecii]|uniref:DUF2934 domain-containing protein n=1 Tax=Methylobacterium brachythecii TaxID=1176177 RepID=A0A7W6F6A1_9HYPH|nr:DUF2934 domain-containing protein [Methylobacterium brachythecii]MBB3902182.1 hypothetical protein [Methylobacterium brachythecii]GLS42027.1 hypothetical protein GCM10007884_00120 [Methylobacterium brachythecii]
MPSQPPLPFAEIRARAYELWDRNHRPEGSEITFWLLAERELRAERAAQVSSDPDVTEPDVAAKPNSEKS